MTITATTLLPTQAEQLRVRYHKGDEGNGLSISVGSLTLPTSLLVRLQSSCVFSEAFGGADCDCALQLKASLELIRNEQRGLLIYLFQEGRGIGLKEKIRALQLQDSEQLNTVEAFRRMGHDPDPRNYEAALMVLRDLQVCSPIRLISNNPRKMRQLEEGGYKVIEMVSLEYTVNQRIYHYLQSKARLLEHRIDFSKLTLNYGTSALEQD